MKHQYFFLGSLLSGSVAATTRRAVSQLANSANGTAPQPKRYIIEFEAVSSPHHMKSSVYSLA